MPKIISQDVINEKQMGEDSVSILMDLNIKNIVLEQRVNDLELIVSTLQNQLMELTQKPTV